MCQRHKRGKTEGEWDSAMNQRKQYFYLLSSSFQHVSLDLSFQKDAHLGQLDWS
jgi:hypothetical protein